MDEVTQTDICAQSAAGVRSRLPGGQWEGVARAYLAEVAKNGSARTAVEYSRVLTRWFAACPELSQATTAQVYGFTYGRGASGREPSPSTVTIRLAAIRGLYDFARRMQLVERNPAEDIRRPKARPATPKGLSPDQLRALLAAIPDSVAGHRDRAIVLVMVFTGLRRAEVMSFTAGSLLDGGRLFRVRVKGGAERKRELPTPALAAIRQWLEAGGHELEQLPPGRRLFPITTQAFYRNLERYGKAAGLGHVTPHTLRHSAAKLRRDAGATIEDVQALLGHRSIATTARYLQRLEGEKDEGWSAVSGLLGL